VAEAEAGAAEVAVVVARFSPLTNMMDVSSISQTERAMLVERFQSGEIGAFDEIVEGYYRYVYRLAYHFTHNYDDAYDISQEVFIKVFKSLGGLKNSSTFDIWLRKVTINACIDYLRQRPNEQVLDDFSRVSRGYIAGSYTELPNNPMEMRELRSMISRAVDRLPKQQRKAFILRHYEGLSLEEIAKTLDRSQGAVKAHLFHATRRLRKLLSHYIL
jgi:RNA polymerase sigma-70 factor (ECF subfamily)